MRSRLNRTFIAEQAPAAGGVRAVQSRARTRRQPLHLRDGDARTQEMEFGLDLLEARGEIEPGSPEADAFVTTYAQGRS